MFYISMNKVSKSIILCILIVITVLLINLFIIKFYYPKINAYRTFVIQGNVTYDSKLIDSKPDYLFLYYPNDANGNLLCTTEVIEMTKINWLNNNSGQYAIKFDVPVGINNVMITNNCASCNYFYVGLNKKFINKDLSLNDKHCMTDFNFGVNVESIIESAKNINGNVDTGTLSSEFTGEKLYPIRSDIGESKKYLDLIPKNSLDDINKSLLNAHLSIWYSYRAEYRFQLAKLSDCLGQISPLLDKFDTSCYQPEYNSYQNYLSANATYYGFLNSFSDPPFTENIEELKTKIKMEKSVSEALASSNYKCSTSLSIINATIKFEKPYCTLIKFNNLFEMFIIAIIFLLLGMFINELYNKRIKNG